MLKNTGGKQTGFVMDLGVSRHMVQSQASKQRFPKKPVKGTDLEETALHIDSTD